MSWVPLHVHSQFSILDASAPVTMIAAKAAEYGMPAVALTDHGNMFGAVDFFKACSKKGVKPLIGCEVYVAPRSRHEKVRVDGEKNAYHLVLLAKDDEGYKNLCRLSSIGHLEGFYYVPRVDKEVLTQYSKGLVCLSACHSGVVAQRALDVDDKRFRDEIQWHRDLYGDDYYLEIQRHGMSDDDIVADGVDRETWLYHDYKKFIEEQNRVNDRIISASKELGIRCVATNDSHYIDRDDWKAHEILLNIQSGEPCEIWEHDAAGNNTAKILNPRRRTYSSHECYFKNCEEMQERFADIPDALAATIDIAEKCNVDLDFDTKHYPVYLPPGDEVKNLSIEEHNASVSDYLRNLCLDRIPLRYTPERCARVKEKYPEKDPLDVVRERLDYEISVIGPKGLCDYLLIVYDFIKWAKDNDIPVGPGRGSGAGSILCYLSGITDIEPLRFDLLFERFINPERMSYPDIDVDICMERRGEVIDYMVKKYGSGNIAQIITFGTMKAKMAVKDVGRVLNVPLAKVNDIAKLIPDELNITIDRALEIDPDLRSEYEGDNEVRRIIDIGRRLEGSIRSTGVHAAGVIVSGAPLIDTIPLCRAKDSDMALSQYAMKPVESVGMLKVDFLGLKTLTAIQKAVASIKERTGIAINAADLPLDDEETFFMLNRGDTLGVFQLESGGMRDLARQLHLDKFEEIIAMVSLYRPGPMDMIPSYINRKHGREAIEYDHPDLEEILGETYGIMVYQEQVMQIACSLAKFSLGEGDILRRAMGKKDMDQMAKMRDKFRDGSKKNNIDEETSMRIFDKMEKFAAYGFNKSHAAAYGYIAYVTAYLKAHYSTEWIAALMSCDRDDIEKVAKFINEAQALGIAILPPDVNEAGKEFVPTTSGIRFAMTAIRGVGSGVVEAIVEERRKRGKYASLYDFVRRIDTKKVGKKVTENLVDAGCFDFTGWQRDAMRQSIESMYASAVKEQNDNAVGVISLFSLMEEERGDRYSSPPKVICSSTKLQTLMREKELLGFFLTGHPMEEYRSIMERLSCMPIKTYNDIDIGGVFRAAFIVEEVSIKISSRSQKKFAILVVSDGGERYELPIWADLYEEKPFLLVENRLLYAVLQVQERDGNRQLHCRWYDDLSTVDEHVLSQCDNAYDKAKFAVERMGRRPSDAHKSTAPKAKQPPKQQPVQHYKDPVIQPLSIALDSESADIATIVKIQDILLHHKGDTPVHLYLCGNREMVTRIAVGKEYYVSGNAAVKSMLQAIPSVTDIV